MERKTLCAWPETLPAGRWRYVDASDPEYPATSYGRFVGRGSTIVFLTDTDIVFTGEGFEPTERFEPLEDERTTSVDNLQHLHTRIAGVERYAQSLERRVAELEAELATQQELVKILQGRLDLQRIQMPPSPFGGFVSAPVSALDPVDMPVADVLAYLEESPLPGDGLKGSK